MVVFYLLLALAAYTTALHLWAKRKLLKRIGKLERDLQQFSNAMSQIADFQLKSHQKFSSNVSDLEERVLELSVPSQDTTLPLERRHQVLSLARQGVSLEDIVKRLNAPVGETELILNLRKYVSGEGRSVNDNQQVGHYA